MKQIIKLNSVQQNESLMVGCIDKQQIEKVFILLDNGAELTPFVLTNLVLKDYSKDDIIKVLLHTNNFKLNIFAWIKNYFAVDELVEVFHHFGFQLPTDYPSNEDCIRLKLWDILSYRNEWNLLAENVPEVIEKKLDSQPYLVDYLLKVDFKKYREFALKEKRYNAILKANKDGWLYLFEQGKADAVFQQMAINSDNLPMDEIMAYCRENNLIEKLYEKEAYITLLKYGEFSVFVEKHSLNNSFLLEFPSKVDWEDLWRTYHEDETYLEYLIDSAKRNKKVPECAEFLKNHTGLRGLFKKIF